MAMRISFLPVACLLLVISLVAGCSQVLTSLPSIGRLQAAEPQLPPSAEPYLQAVEDAFEDIQLLSILRAEDAASLIEPGDMSRNVGHNVVLALKSIRIREDRLYASMRDLVPTTMAQRLRRVASVKDEQLATVIDEQVRRRVARTSGGVRYRVSQAVAAELDAVCNQRRLQWLTLIKQQLAANPTD